MFVPEAELPIWVISYIPIFFSILNILPAPKSFPFIVPYILFKNTMSVTKFTAMISGLFQLGSSYEWIVTKKTGRSEEYDLTIVIDQESKKISNQLANKSVGPDPVRGALDSESLEIREDEEEKKKPVSGKKSKKIFYKELALACLLLTAAVKSVLDCEGVHFYFLLFQGLTFLVVGLDLVGE